MLDGHGSKMGLPFLCYINDPVNIWIACIGVPYETSLWKVSDAAEKNGTSYQEGVNNNEEDPNST